MSEEAEPTARIDAVWRAVEPRTVDPDWHIIVRERSDVDTVSVAPSDRPQRVSKWPEDRYVTALTIEPVALGNCWKRPLVFVGGTPISHRLQWSWDWAETGRNPLPARLHLSDPFPVGVFTPLYIQHDGDTVLKVTIVSQPIVADAAGNPPCTSTPAFARPSAACAVVPQKVYGERTIMRNTLVLRDGLSGFLTEEC